MKNSGRLLLVALIGSLLIICTASAHIIEEKSGYIVRSGYDSEKISGFPSIDTLSKSMYSITDGKINYHSIFVGTGKTSITYDVDWGDSGNDLGLRIKTPDGSYLGYYHDSVDGATDGRIYIEIFKSNGLASGYWENWVKGFSVSGTEYYNWEVSIA